MDEDEDVLEPLSVAKAEYEEFFGEGRDPRAHAAKLVDTRGYERDGGAG